MSVVAEICVALVAALHFYFLVLEMFLWEKPVAARIFGLTKEFATASRTLAGNQGLYNGFVGSGLLWSLWLGLEGRPFTYFLLVCVAIAGLYGTLTINRKPFYAQTLPAVAAMLLLSLSY